EKIFALLIAEREGTAIMGPKLHAALLQQSLQFGARKIYHRMSKGMVVFSVASLLKPGELDPAQAQGFSTPGLSVFMVLPGPIKPAAAYADMVATARALARSLNAEVFDSRKQLFGAEAERAQKVEIEEWARANRLA
ncbi:MAG TPA: cell division protein ZipA C-terminal FtsZ-binding domain-containing protein, partial [Nevskiaceae bacterium]|nr:cell division protein ZipA C-terminal FtsZ-binding domain-containing protein [Nevskiaceae bacterium]